MNENAPSPSRPKEATFLWRRAAAITAIAALIIVPSVLLFINETRGGGGTKKVAIPPTPNAARDAKLGIAVGWPDGWHLSRKRGDFKLISDDRTSAFLVSSPAPAKQAIGVFTSAAGGGGEARGGVGGVGKGSVPGGGRRGDAPEPEKGGGGSGGGLGRVGGGPRG